MAQLHEPHAVAQLRMLVALHQVSTQAMVRCMESELGIVYGLSWAHGAYPVGRGLPPAGCCY
jgi:hypothetical protein